MTVEIMMSNVITGSCCCGEVTFKIEGIFSKFYFCHCVQCRKLTGSAHASNLFTSPDNITWISGENKIQRYDHQERSFSKAFCKSCGSGLPFISRVSKSLIVPAGSLNEEPNAQVDAQIFCTEETQWHKIGVKALKVVGFPK